MKDKPENGQAGAEVTPIEVTPEMTEAGSMELLDYKQGEDSGSEVCARIYREMERVRRSRLRALARR